VRRGDTASWEYRRPESVVFSFQIICDEIEPPVGNCIRNLFSSDDRRTALAYEAVELGPEMAVVDVPSAFSVNGERLTRAASGPDFSVFRPAGKPERKTPSSNPGEEMALRKSGEVIGFDQFDTSFINMSFGYLTGGNQVPQPLRCVRVELVVVVHSLPAPSNNTAMFNSRNLRPQGRRGCSRPAQPKPKSTNQTSISLLIGLMRKNPQP
jgi:hypothetical protein